MAKAAAKQIKRMTAILKHSISERIAPQTDRIENKFQKQNKEAPSEQLECIAKISNFQCIDMFQSIATLRSDMFQSIATLRIDMKHINMYILCSVAID